MITSSQNKWVKYIKQLHKANKRKKLKEYLLEGEHLIEEAVKYHAKLKIIFYTKDYEEFINKLNVNCEVIEITNEVLKEMAMTNNPQGVTGICYEPEKLNTEEISGKILGIDGVKDPGNLGTMIRTADAAGYQNVILNKGTVDIYNPKVLRSMQGSQYHLNIFYEDFKKLIPTLKEKEYKIYATALDKTAKDYKEIKHQDDKFMVIMGNEGQGVSKEVLELSNQKVYITMPGKAESLNVAVATGVVLFGWL